MAKNVDQAVDRDDNGLKKYFKPQQRQKHLPNCYNPDLPNEVKKRSSVVVLVNTKSKHCFELFVADPSPQAEYRFINKAQYIFFFRN